MAERPSRHQQIVAQVEMLLRGVTLTPEAAFRLHDAVHRATRPPELGTFPPGTVVEVPNDTFYSTSRGMMTAEQILQIQEIEQYRMRAAEFRRRAEYEAMHQRMIQQAESFTAAAKQRAHDLLCSHLTEAQRREYQQSGGKQFCVTGGTSGDSYIIFSMGRVTRVRDHHEFCLQVVGEPVPAEDAMLARKILIESNEPLFLSTANDLTAGEDNHYQGAIDELEHARRRVMEQERRAERQAFHEAQQAAATAVAERGGRPETGEAFGAFRRWYQEYLRTSRV